MRKFRTLALRDNLRGHTIRCGTGLLFIDPDGFTGEVNEQTALALQHLGGFAEVFEEGKDEHGAAVLHPADEEGLAATPAWATKPDEPTSPSGKGSKKKG